MRNRIQTESALRRIPMALNRHMRNFKKRLSPVGTAPSGTHAPALCLCLAAALFLCGCSLAREELPPAEGRLAGLFVTADYIEPEPPELEIDRHGEIVAKDQEPRRIYGSLASHDSMGQAPVSFPGLEGYGIYRLELPADDAHEAATYNTCDPVFTDLHINVSDQEESVEASLYVPANRIQRYYFHPVYQQANGQIYLVPGSGISTDSFVAGQRFAESISQSMSQTGQGEESVAGYRFTVNIVAAESPKDTQLLFLDSEDLVIGRLSPEELDALFQEEAPELALPAGISYLIMRQTLGASDSHTAYDRTCEYLEYMAPQGDSPLQPRQLRLLWPDL